MIFMQVDDDKTKRSILVLVIEVDNFVRMKAGDPITLMPESYGGFIQPINIPRARASSWRSKPIWAVLRTATRSGCADTTHHRGYRFTPVDGIHVTPGDKGGAS